MLINFQRCGDDVYSFWNSYGAELLEPLGVEGLLMNAETNSWNALVMIYRRDLLALALNDETAAAILANLDYPLPDVDACLEHLRNRYLVEFPLTGATASGCAHGRAA